VSPFRTRLNPQLFPFLHLPPLPPLYPGTSEFPCRYTLPRRFLTEYPNPLGCVSGPNLISWLGDLPPHSRSPFLRIFYDVFNAKDQTAPSFTSGSSGTLPPASPLPYTSPMSLLSEKVAFSLLFFLSAPHALPPQVLARMLPRSRTL